MRSPRASTWSHRRWLESLEAVANSALELKEFIPINKINPVYFEHGYFLARDQDGEKPYRLLADSMQQVGRGALAEMVSPNKENLVLIRPAKGGRCFRHVLRK